MPVRALIFDVDGTLAETEDYHRRAFNQLFTHFIYPRGKVPEFAVNPYPRFIEPMVRTYKDIGVNANCRPANDIHVNGRKIGGTGATACRLAADVPAAAFRGFRGCWRG